jgi:hypothetical protein
MTANALDLPSPDYRAPDGVVRREDLHKAGVSQYAMAKRCRPEGPWQILLPGVLLLTKAPPTRLQRLRAALLYVNTEDAVITGAAALHEHGLGPLTADEVHVLVRSDRRVSTRNFVRVERTTRLPRPVISSGLRFAPPIRAAVDAARHTSDQARKRAYLLAPVHGRLHTLEQMRTELNAGSQRGTAALRALLNEPIAPALITTVHHGWALRVLRQTPLPPPSWNVTVYNEAGKRIGIADAWWHEVGLGWDFGNQRDGHSLARQTAFAKEGLHLVTTTVADLRGSAEQVSKELSAAFLRATRRPRPPIRTTT